MLRPGASVSLKPLFISIDGPDGCGKSSQVAHIQEVLTRLGAECVLTREPGGTPLAEDLRAMVLSQHMDPLTEALLVFAARRDHLKNVIQPALARGQFVLSDRFTDATYAYQGAGRGFDFAVLRQLEEWVQEGQQPDLTLLFDLDPAISAARMARSRGELDRFEQEDLTFFRRVRTAYLQRAEDDPDRFVIIDASRPIEEVAAAVESALLERVTAAHSPAPR